MKDSDRQLLIHRLNIALGPEEGRAVFRWLLDEFPGAGIEDGPTARLNSIVKGLEEGHPLQYLLGKAPFMGLDFSVNPSVLIPRPETEELVYLLLQEKKYAGKTLLDLCTGSGCIAISLEKKGSFSRVEGLDVSLQALETARANAAALEVKADFFAFDLLRDSFPEAAGWDLWISNPPYVGASEAAAMENRVLLHEPALALFVPDDDVVCFYRRIMQLSETHLNPAGEIFLEINPLHAEATLRLFTDAPWMESAELLSDMSGKQRFIRVRKK